MRAYPWLTGIFITLAACSNSSTPEFSKGQTPLAQALFDLQSISSLDIAKADPATGDVWSARFRQLPQSGREGNGPLWEVSSGPGGGSLLDRKAQGGFINHLLDTLKTLRVSELAPKGPPESFGLVPPRFALRFGTSEIRFGNDSYAAIGNQIYKVEGAALKMLEYIPSFESLREQKLLASLVSDDFDEVEIKRKGHKPFYTQRDGSAWTDRHHKPVQKSLNEFLEQWTHMRIEKFIDDPALAPKISKKIEEQPLAQILLRGRNQPEILVRLQWQTLDGTDGLYATTSNRPGSVFRIYPEAARSFSIF